MKRLLFGLFFFIGCACPLTAQYCTPSTQDYNIVVTPVSATSFTLSWSPGSGGHRIVVGKAATSISSNPTDLTTYTANTTFGSGSQIGTGNYVVYNGTGSSVTITGLTTNVVYTFKVFEYAGSSGVELYNTANATRNPRTITAGQVIIVVYGDSISRGANNTTGPGPTPTAGTVKQWNGSSVIDIGSADIFNVLAGGGTFMPRCGINFNAATGFIPVFVSCGSDASNLAFETADLGNNWSPSGGLRVNLKTQVALALEATGQTQPYAFVGDGGVNDARGTEDMTTVVQPGIDAFFTWLSGLYPGTPILHAQVGRNELANHNDRLYAVRERIVLNARNISDVYMNFNFGSWIGAGGYGGDNLHPNQSIGNEAWGVSAAQGLVLITSSYSKWAKSIIASQWDDLTSGRKTLIDNFVTTVGADLFRLEHLGHYKTSNQGNTYVDWTFLGYTRRTNGTYVANSHIATTTNQYYAYSFLPAVNNKRATSTDFFSIIKVKANSTSAGTRAFAFGGTDGPEAMGTSQESTSTLGYFCNDATTSTSALGGTSFQAGHWYGCARNGTTKYLLKDNAVVVSVTQAVVAPLTIEPYIGALNNMSSNVLGNNAQYEMIISGQYSTVNMSNLISAADALLAGW